jgi:stearoyl-CoA desaturase (delta-9 desaturase)
MDEDIRAAPHGERDPFPYGHDSAFGKAMILLVVFLPLAGLAYAVARAWGHGIGWLEVGLMLGLWAFTGLGISIGFHRMLTHHALVARPAARFVLLVAGTMAVQGGPAGWAATHQRHHAKADHEGDPHSPEDGFWHAHVGWLLRDHFVHDGPAYDRFMEDPVVRFVSKTWMWWTAFSFLLPAAIGWAVHGTWLGALDAAVWAGLIRVALGHHLTWSVNSVCHSFGTKPFRSPDRAANNGLVAWFSWGEGWHNNHHAFPRAAYIGMRWYQVDVAKQVIRLLKALHLVGHVWNPTPEQRRARLAKPRRANA